MGCLGLQMCVNDSFFTWMKRFPQRDFCLLVNFWLTQHMMAMLRQTTELYLNDLSCHKQSHGAKEPLFDGYKDLICNQLRGSSHSGERGSCAWREYWSFWVKDRDLLVFWLQSVTASQRVAHFRDVTGQSAGEQAEPSLWKLLSS